MQVVRRGPNLVVIARGNMGQERAYVRFVLPEGESNSAGGFTGFAHSLHGGGQLDHQLTHRLDVKDKIQAGKERLPLLHLPARLFRREKNGADAEVCVSQDRQDGFVHPGSILQIGRPLRKRAQAQDDGINGIFRFGRHRYSRWTNLKPDSALGRLGQRSDILLSKEKRPG
jgi:hypothetical protein